MTRKPPIVRDYMTKLPVEVDHLETIERAASLMAEAGVRHLPVMRGYHLFGVLSQRDVQFAEARWGPSAGSRPVEDICVRHAVQIRPTAPITEAAERMHGRRIGSVVVVDGEMVVGMLSTTDLLRALMDVYGHEY